MNRPRRLPPPVQSGCRRTARRRGAGARLLTLAIAAGEQVAVIGPSGAGQSTLLHAIACALKPAEGRLLLDDVAHADDRALARASIRLALNALRSISELVWAALLIISAGLEPFAGTRVLAMQTTGVLGRLFAEAIENAPPGPAFALRAPDVALGCVFLNAMLPQIVPQIASCTLYRRENNIRAAAVLGVAGAGGLGWRLAFPMGRLQMRETSSNLIAMIALVALVDLGSDVMWRVLAR